MNKDVIYIEPEDDITDVITKIEKAKNKIVALVPPKKAGVFRSIVNIKLIAKAGLTSEKTVVLVTTDPSVVKLAAATRIPVAESLQSAPSIPDATVNTGSAEMGNEGVEKVDAKDNNENGTEGVKAEGSASEITENIAGNEGDNLQGSDRGEESASEIAENGEEKAEGATKIKLESIEDKPEEKKEKKPAGDSGFGGWIKEHKKLLIFGGVFGVALVVALVWAFGFAPAVDISVAIKTDQKNFSENVTFVKELKDENAKEGKFYIEEKRSEEVKEVTFEATGKQNVGEKAKGDLIVWHYFPATGGGGNIPINAGTAFTINKLSYLADSNTSLVWDGKDSTACDNKSDDPVKFAQSGCRVSARIKVTAAQSGANYNIAPAELGWNTLNEGIGIYSDKAMSGGTDEYVTIVQQSDVEKAKEELSTSSETVNKAKLISSVGEGKIVIEESFKQETSDAVPTPGVDQEVKEGEKATLKTTTVASIYVVDKVKLEEFIEEKAKLEGNQKIFEIRDIYLDGFIETEEGIVAKLKAQYFIGPKITEGELVEKILGKGLGDARREIGDVYGVSDVKIETSYPWVMAVPGDSNKVTIKFNLAETRGE